VRKKKKKKKKYEEMNITEVFLSANTKMAKANQLVQHKFGLKCS
jgi:hypothetical protein